jgi:L-lactate dehydrogenase complex protein LldG
MTARDEILAKIKTALGLDDAARREAARDGHHAAGLSNDLSPLPSIAMPSPQQVTRDCHAQRDGLIAGFEAMLTRAGGYFTIANDAQAVVEGIAEIASTARTTKAVGWHSPVLEQLGVGARLAESGIELITDSADKAAFIREAAEASIGITAVDYALADSGTLCLLADKHQPRTASLLPPVHVAILRPEQILRGLDDLFALLPAGRDLSSAVTLITGPSRTADIELTLVVGVHGPQQLHVILAND